ncbi:hypothetical protein GCM10023231_11800 [Olivibacter ginsenosidimutans]|uniref:Glycosyltransferase 2-like domain-containing protein n=1 Tax=Olivibacter ginsenosidimutans TaxID=1176537 RepID=A0ABP9ATR3_9SPHI
MKVSVVIPCYNCADFVRNAVDSVFSQSYKNWELLLVDNNSKDNTFDTLKMIEAEHPDSVKVLKELKRGAPAARNKGLESATGEWIQYLDADDILLPDKLAHQISMIKNSNVDVICGSYTFVQKVNPRLQFFKKLYYAVCFPNLSLRGNTLEIVKKPYLGNIWEGLICSQLGITSANLWKKRILNEVGGWNEQLTSSQEYDLLFRILKMTQNVVRDTKPLTLVFRRSNSISIAGDRDRKVRILLNFLNLREQIVSYLQGKGLYNNRINRFYNRFIFRYLMRAKNKAPEEISVKIKQLDLNIPIWLKIRENITFLLKK